MPLNQTIVEIMRLWWEQQGKPKTGLVFPSPVTGRQLDKKAYIKPWTRVKKLGGLPADLDFYALRHNFISALVAQGLPMLTIAKLAGHKSTAMIEKHYAHLCPQQAAEAVDVLARHARGSEAKRRAEA
jgi:integrase